MADLAAADTSPLIILTKGGFLDLLRLVAHEVIVPSIVAAEIEQRGPDDPAVQALRNTSWLRLVQAVLIPTAIEAWDLGPGESSVLAWAVAHPGTEAIVDDLKARRCAAALRIPVRGTVGLVLLAKQRGVIPAARPVIEHLRRSGLYLSDHVMNQALARVGE